MAIGLRQYGRSGCIGQGSAEKPCDSTLRDMANRAQAQTCLLASAMLEYPSHSSKRCPTVADDSKSQRTQNRLLSVQTRILSRTSQQYLMTSKSPSSHHCQKRHDQQRKHSPQPAVLSVEALDRSSVLVPLTLPVSILAVRAPN